MKENLRRDTSEEMSREIELMLWRAMKNGLPVIFQDRVHALIKEFNDVFRLLSSVWTHQPGLLLSVSN